VKAHELAKELLKSKDFEVNASIDISTCDADSDRRIFTIDCMGVNDFSGDVGEITILFFANPKDNQGKTL
tara:strand:+ start:22 stop:231 length:210 start_codon:yes stop_codon:yes gene_type:complete